VVLRGQPTDVRLYAWTSAKGRLSAHQREEILLGLHHGMSVRAIAQALGYAPSMVTRKLPGNGGRGSYFLWPSHQRVRIGTKRPNAAELYNSAWSWKVTPWLEKFWSPDEKSRRLHRAFPGDPIMQLSRETIRQSLYLQGRGELPHSGTNSVPALESGRDGGPRSWD
jgi:IS30 family transposase